MKKSAGLLGVLLAVALTGCGISSTAREAPAKARVLRTTTPATTAPSTQPPTTAAPITAPVSPDLTNFVHAWSVHCCGLEMDRAGHFRVRRPHVRLVWGWGRLRATASIGNEIHDGAMAKGVIVSRTGNVARARVTLRATRRLSPEAPRRSSMTQPTTP